MKGSSGQHSSPAIHLYDSLISWTHAKEEAACTYSPS